jgi:uncharacterized protein
MDVAFVLVVLVHARARRDELRPLFREHGFRRATIVSVAGVLLAMALFVEGYFQLARWLHLRELRYLDDYRQAHWPLGSAFLMVAVVPGIFEEIAFRGVIQTGLQSILRPGEALLLQAAMFSVLHLSPLMFVSHFVIGLAFGWIRTRTGSLMPSIAAHAAWNASVLLRELLAG